MGRQRTGVTGDLFAEIAVSLPVWRTFTYRVPLELEYQIEVGKRALVPFQRRRVTGYVVAFPAPLSTDLNPGSVKAISDVLDGTPLFDGGMLHFFRWVSQYYRHPIGEVIKTGLPPGLNVETCRILKITPEGRARLLEFPRDSLECRLLEVVAKEGEASRAAVSRSLKEPICHRILCLEKDNLLTEEVRLKKERVGAKREPLIVFQGDEGSEREGLLTPRESEILAFIKEKQSLSRRDLRIKYPRASYYIRRLADKGMITLGYEERYRDPFGGEDFGSETKPVLSLDQEKVMAEIDEALTRGRYAPFLLYGVTGSGKTEIYLRAIQQVIAEGKEAIVLVPEISLTPQLTGRFKRRFKKGIAVLHSGLSPGERYDQWRQILKGEVKIAIGARSAVFAPFRRLGVVIVDEEHETSFKQEEKLKYNARDLAVMRAKLSDALLILGSATPSLESFFNARTEKFRALTLPQRVESRSLPSVEIVDMRAERRGGKFPVFSERLKQVLAQNHEKGRQSLLFLNRRGFANFILCRECGWTFQCPNCSVTLTYHAVHRTLRCHHCDFMIPVPPCCPKCQGFHLYPMGMGTQRIEDEIVKLIPSARIARMDRDTTTRKGSYQGIIRAVELGEVDILIGTQMIVKGHDFPNITLVGIICADTILNFPDFRSSERTFQLLTQAGGRAGRGDEAGRVIIQTFNPSHYSIQAAGGHDFMDFYEKEIRFREELRYPPFSRLANLRISGNSEQRTQDFARQLSRVGHRIIQGRKVYLSQIDLLGPSSAPLAKVKGKYRWQLLVRSTRTGPLHRFINELVGRMGREAAGVRLEVDIDPLNLM